VIHLLQALLEIDAGEYHAFQCERFATWPTRHVPMDTARQHLLDRGYVEYVGNELALTQEGRDALEAATCAAFPQSIRN